MLTAELTNDSFDARSRYLATVGALVLFVVVSVLLHWRLVTSDLSSFAPGLTSGGLRPNTAVFAAVGFMFLTLTVLALAPALPRRQLTRHANSHVDPMMLLVLPMAIRFAGTFAILGGLLWTQLLSRNEAVFDVFFWYVSLTTMEVVGIVWASKTQYSTGSIPSSSATKGV